MKKKPILAIVDFDAGNMASLKAKTERLGVEVVVADHPSKIREVDGLLLCGVGHFGKAMDTLRDNHFIDVLNESVFDHNMPVLGICLGMQLFAEFSEEGSSEGLGWIPGEVVRIQSSSSHLRVPHIGWQILRKTKPSRLLTAIAETQNFYFVHGFHFNCKNKGAVIARSDYGDLSFVSAVESGNIFGTQFHPEKSHRRGMDVIRNFIDATVGQP